MSVQIEFKRAVFGFDMEASNAGALEVAVRLAELLHLDLIGLFIRDERLDRAAAYPGAREFVPSLQGWRILQTSQLSQELDIAASGAERALRAKATLRRLTCSFNVMAGDVTRLLGSFAAASDILILPEQRSGLAAFRTPASLLLEAASRSAAAVLLVPTNSVLLNGAVLAIATSPEDPSINVAAAIASAAKERLIIIEAYDVASSPSPAQALPFGGACERIYGGKEVLRDPGLLFHLIGPPSEGLIVHTRRPDRYEQQAFSSALAHFRNAPVLVLEPSKSEKMVSVPETKNAGT